ncbi:hypothetical protein PAXRUDRAFT_36809 [Paxillus rubicundulus Ve08.2h10]|uniref:TERF2-interacting telomeric protein 1 Myb domain-containing protein n=1 Tax=Paxillus rubicundulus Ve08.2h10 TaxID=930991 RepID=A0A0D0CPQ5_9AGAM|nr:hypothetical protein PAXRUDRAFT_36809 [Paxillus rubicundulus Ve08.2h10]
MPQAKIRVQYTNDDDTQLMKYLARYSATKAGRSGARLYRDLEANEDNRWPWADRHPWQSWRERYVKNAEYFDPRIAKYQEKHGLPKPPKADSSKAAPEGRRLPLTPPNNAKKAEVKLKKGRIAERENEPGGSRQPKRPRVDDDGPSSNPPGTGKPNGLPLVNPDPDQVNNKRGFQSSTAPSLPNGGDSVRLTATPPRHVFLLVSLIYIPNVAHRPRAGRNGLPNEGDARLRNQAETQTLSDTPPTGQPHSPKLSHEAPNLKTTATSPTPHPVVKPPSTTLDLPPLPKRNDTLVLPSSPAQPSPNGRPGYLSSSRESKTPPRSQQLIRKRPRTPSDMFASVPPSPAVVSANANITSSNRPGARSAPAARDSHPRAPPRRVETLIGQVLVDQMGRVPRIHSAAAHGNAEEDEDEKEEWPPTRGRRAAKGKGKEQVVPEHHEFSQRKPRYKTEVRDAVARPPHIKEETQSTPPPTDKNRVSHPFGQVGRVDARDTAKQAVLKPEGGGAIDRWAIATRFLGGNAHEVAKVPEIKSKDRKKREPQKAHDDPPLSQRTPLRKPDATPVMPIPRQSVKFPAPRPSTRSPFRLPGHPHQQPTFRNIRHPALARVKHQTIGHGHENVPCIDLVAMSASDSVSSTTSYHSSNRPRWSLPAHTTPPLFRDGDAPPFRRLAPAPLYTGPHPHAQSPSLTRTPSSAPSLPLVPTFTSSPIGTSHAGTSSNLAPHPADLPITASHGLASILVHMSENHGLALSVVHAVYARVGSLREADDILRGMREAAEGFGEAEIERRRSRGSAQGKGEEGKERSIGRQSWRRHTRRASEGTRLQYVVASEDGEGSEYSPPETSRAAMWKRQEASHVTDVLVGETAKEGEQGEQESDDVGDARGVEEELEEVSEDDGAHEDEEWLPNVHHDFSRQVPAHDGSELFPDAKVAGDIPRVEQDAWEEYGIEALLVNEEAFQLEQKVGKEKYRRLIVGLFR